MVSENWPLSSLLISTFTTRLGKANSENFDHFGDHKKSEKWYPTNFSQSRVKPKTFIRFWVHTPVAVSVNEKVLKPVYAMAQISLIIKDIVFCNSPKSANFASKFHFCDSMDPSLTLSYLYLNTQIRLICFSAQPEVLPLAHAFFDPQTRNCHSQLFRICPLRRWFEQEIISPTWLQGESSWLK